MAPFESPPGKPVPRIASLTDNGRILCQGHNLEAARQACGDELMDLFTRSTYGPVAREEVAEYAAPGVQPSIPETIRIAARAFRTACAISAGHRLRERWLTQP